MRNDLLEKAIQESGYKKTYLSECLGLSTRAFTYKLSGEVDWWRNEVEILSNLLGLSKEEKEKIFFD